MKAVANVPRMGLIRLERAYDPPAPDSGIRILVDRLWPRGLARTQARIDIWLKDVAPSTELRRWFGHEAAKWPEFQRRYRAELANNPALATLRDIVGREPRTTLVFAAKDAAHNNAVVLHDLLHEGDRPFAGNQDEGTESLR